MAKDNPPTSPKDASPKPGKAEKLIRVFHANRTKRSFLHGDYRLDPGGSAIVPEEVAKLWTEHKYYDQHEVTTSQDQSMPLNVVALQREAADAKAGEAEAMEEVGRLSEQIKSLETLLAQAKGQPVEKKPNEQSLV